MCDTYYDLTHTVRPVVRNVSNRTEVNVTLAASLACLTSGYPLPSITWQKEGEELDQSMDGRVTFFAFNVSEMGVIASTLVQMAGFSMEEVESLGELGVVGVLTFEMVEREDTDMYTCTATNSLPETMEIADVSDPVQLVVLGMDGRGDNYFHSPLVPIVDSIFISCSLVHRGA